MLVKLFNHQILTTPKKKPSVEKSKKAPIYFEVFTFPGTINILKSFSKLL
jgi:hypothetical protein